MTERPTRTLEATAGEPLHVGVPVLDATGAEVPITAEWKAHAQVRGHWSSTSALYSWSTELDGMTLDLDRKLIVLEAPAEHTITWQDWPAPAVWDLFAIDPDGIPRKLIKASPVLIEPAVSRLP